MASWSVYFLITTYHNAETFKLAASGVLTFVGGLLTVHLAVLNGHYFHLIVTGYTQREHMKRERLYGADATNPYDNGCSDKLLRSDVRLGGEGGFQSPCVSVISKQLRG